MNHLAHFKVAHPETGLIVGGFLGDFVKGRLKGDYPPCIERGIRLHRAVDAFTDRHAITRRAASRFEPRFRRYAPIMIDVIFDHFLAQQWHTWNDLSLSRFADDVFQALDHGREHLDSRARATADRMCEARSLERYAEQTFVARALAHLGTRLRRDNPLDHAFDECRRIEAELERDFECFFPELLAFCQEWQARH